MWLDVVVRIVCKILRNVGDAFSPLLHPGKGKSRRLGKLVRVTDEYIHLISKSCLAYKPEKYHKRYIIGILLQVPPKQALCTNDIETQFPNKRYIVATLDQSENYTRAIS